MRLKEKNSKALLFVGILIITIASCTNKANGVLSEEEKRELDSLNRLKQRAYSDSMRKANPMLIMPPDSEYTGEYIDKYPSGVIKFKGLFRFGQRHGDWFCFYPTGIKWSELTFDNGIKAGKNVAYYPEGNVRYEGYYKNDLQDSLWFYYDSIGQVIEKITFKD
jgi:antitoxin component YwqK of YwqJK toxin-antitoxin module